MRTNFWDGGDSLGLGHFLGVGDFLCGVFVLWEGDNYLLFLCPGQNLSDILSTGPANTQPTPGPVRTPRCILGGPCWISKSKRF